MGCRGRRAPHTANIWSASQKKAPRIFFLGISTDLTNDPDPGVGWFFGGVGRLIGSPTGDETGGSRRRLVSPLPLYSLAPDETPTAIRRLVCQRRANLMDSSDLSSSNGYCDKCHGLFSTVAALEALASPAGYQHHIGAEAKASADRGCPLCQKLLIKWPDRTSRETDQLVCWAARSGRRCQTNPAGFIPEIEVSVPYIFDGLICYRLGIGEHSHQRWLRTFTLFADSGT